MKIKKYVKISSKKYKTILEDNSSITLYEDIILKYELLLKKEITNLEELLNINAKYELYDKCLNYLNKRQRTEKEIFKYLEKYTTNKDDIENIITKLKNNNLLNNKNYIKSYIQDKINLTLDGKEKIKRNLQQLGLNEDEILNELVIFDNKLNFERIRKYINKNLKNNKNSLYIFKNKMLINLINLGYDRNDILKELNLISINEDNLKEKEIEKLKKKYSRKYSGYELDLIIKKKLYEKGFH